MSDVSRLPSPSTLSLRLAIDERPEERGMRVELGGVVGCASQAGVDGESRPRTIEAFLDGAGELW